MKLVLTGIANEVNLSDPKKTRFMLVFNEGQLRVDVPEETAQEVVNFAANVARAEEHAEEEPEDTDDRYTVYKTAEDVEPAEDGPGLDLDRDKDADELVDQI